MSSYKNYCITVEFHLNGSRKCVEEYLIKHLDKQPYQYEIKSTEEE